MVMDDSLSGKFSKAFKNKMLHFFDDVSLMLEYGIAAFLDPRQKNLGRFKFIWDVTEGCPPMPVVLKEWPTKDKFMEEVVQQTVANCKSCLTEEEVNKIEEDELRHS